MPGAPTTNRHRKTDVQLDVPPLGVAPIVPHGSRKCVRQPLLTNTGVGVVVLWRCCGRTHDAPKRIGMHIVFSHIRDQVLHLISRQKLWSSVNSLRSEGRDSLQSRRRDFQREDRMCLVFPGWAWCLSLSWSGKALTELSRQLSMAQHFKNKNQAIKNISMA